MTKTNPLATTAVVLALGSGTALAEMDWDDNDDGLLDSEEFGLGFDADGRFDAFDGNRDGVLDSDELGARLGDEDFRVFDGGRDRLLDRDEFATGVYDSYDSNRDGMLDESEGGVAEQDMGEGGVFDM